MSSKPLEFEELEGPGYWIARVWYSIKTREEFIMDPRFISDNFNSNDRVQLAELKQDRDRQIEIGLRRGNTGGINYIRAMNQEEIDMVRRMLQL